VKVLAAETLAKSCSTCAASARCPRRLPRSSCRKSPRHRATLSEVRGIVSARCALEMATAGGPNLLML
jgi:predicted ATPase with chaperone activity